MVTALLVTAWMCRYDVTPIEPVRIASDAEAAAYVLDRWTGEIELMAGQIRIKTVRP